MVFIALRESRIKKKKRNGFVSRKRFKSAWCLSLRQTKWRKALYVALMAFKCTYCFTEKKIFIQCDNPPKKEISILPKKVKIF